MKKIYDYKTGRVFESKYDSCVIKYKKVDLETGDVIEDCIFDAYDSDGLEKYPSIAAAQQDVNKIMHNIADYEGLELEDIASEVDEDSMESVFTCGDYQYVFTVSNGVDDLDSPEDYGEDTEDVEDVDDTDDADYAEPVQRSPYGSRHMYRDEAPVADDDVEYDDDSADVAYDNGDDDDVEYDLEVECDEDEFEDDLNEDEEEEEVVESFGKRRRNRRSTKESVALKFSKMRRMFESDEEETAETDDEETKDEEGEESTDKKGDGESGDDDDEEMKAVVLTVAADDAEDCKKELIDAGVDEDDIEILDGDDDETSKVRVDVNSVMELKDYLADKGIDLEEKIGGEIVSDDEDGDDESGDDKEQSDDKEGGDDDFDWDNMGDVFGADDAE